MYPTLRFADPTWPETVTEELARFAAEVEDELVEAERVGRFPVEVYEEMGRRGWVGPFTPVSHGGLGGGIAEYCLIEEEVGRHGLVAPQVSAQGQRWLLDWGTDEQRDRYLDGMARGKIIFSESISEPGAGSSLRALRTTARRDGSDWLIHGEKTHVNLGHQSHVTLVYAAADEGMTAFLVDTSLPGVSSVQTEPIGLRLMPTADMTFDQVRVPADAVLGEVGRGMDTFFSTFNVSRLGNASELIGFGRRAMHLGVTYARDRHVGDSRVTDFQGIQWLVAESYERLYSASLARDHAANLADRGEEHAMETTMAKKLAIGAAEYAVNEVFSLVGGHGLYRDREYARLIQDTKVLRVAGGSLEVLRNYVARSVLRSERLGGLT
ncbi:MAG TPA: acyl-CoA dehydrogenase family protein [Acidimicrobiales bacterium]